MLVLKSVRMEFYTVHYAPPPPGQMIGVVTKSPKALASVEMIDAQKTHPSRGIRWRNRAKESLNRAIDLI